MNILLYEDVIVHYLSNRNREDNNNLDGMVRAIMENKNSVFLFSKKLLTLLENKVEKKDMYQKFLTKLTNLREKKLAINYESSEETTSFEEEFVRIYKIHTSRVLITIALEEPSLTIKQITNDRIAVLSQQQKPNYHWLVVNLAILHPFTLSVDEIDFDNDAQTDKFFDDLFSIPRTISEVTIFDDYYNLGKHNKYAKIAKPKNVFVHYCTKNHYKETDGNNNLNGGKYSFLKENFPKLNLHTKNRGSHTRRIIFEGFIINPDIDLDLLNKTGKKMWSVHIRFSEERAGEIIEIRNKDYKKFNPTQ